MAPGISGMRATSGVAKPHCRASYAPLENSVVEQLREDAERAVTEMTDELRLSLSGAQSKVAWYLPEEVDARDAALSDWKLPLGTAPSSHIVKVARRGREELAYNEFVCDFGMRISVFQIEGKSARLTEILLVQPQKTVLAK